MKHVVQAVAAAILIVVSLFAGFAGASASPAHSTSAVPQARNTMLPVASESIRFAGAPTRVPTPTQTPRPVSAAPVRLPVRLRAASGWEFIVQGVYILAAIDGPSERFVPDRGAYVALVGTLTNYTNKDGCIKGDDFRLISDSGTSSIESSTIDAAKTIFRIDYPGLFRGQCLDYDKSAQSFLVFDANPYVYSWLNMQGAEAAIGSPLAVSSMFVRPTATPVPTPTPGIPPEIQLYMGQVAHIVNLVSPAAVSIKDAIEQPAIYNPEWRANIIVQMAIMRSGYLRLSEIIPPAALAGVHPTLVAAMQRCDAAIGKIATSIDSGDVQLTDETRQLFQECSTGLSTYTQQMSDILSRYE